MSNNTNQKIIGYIVGGGLKENLRVRLKISPQGVQEGAFVVIQSGNWHFYGLAPTRQLLHKGQRRAPFPAHQTDRSLGWCGEWRVWNGVDDFCDGNHAICAQRWPVSGSQDSVSAVRRRVYRNWDCDVGLHPQASGGVRGGSQTLSRTAPLGEIR